MEKCQYPLTVLSGHALQVTSFGSAAAYDEYCDWVITILFCFSFCVSMLAVDKNQLGDSVKKSTAHTLDPC